jgi:probable HAF family extracellular repeat protein
MKSRLLFSMSVLGLLAPLAMPVGLAQEARPQPTHYTVTDLGPPTTVFSQATFVNNSVLVTGLATLPDNVTQHAVLWYKGQIMDIGAPGLGGPNSAALGVNEFGQVIGQAETSTPDPNNENFCAYFTGLVCLPFLWQQGVMTPLPLLGGNNGTVSSVNNRGEVAGIAENSTRDYDCPSTPALNGSGPQALDFEAVIWGPGRGQIRELHPLPGDTVGMANWINENGQAVGVSGLCSNTTIPGFEAGPRAVLWEKDGSVHDLGNLGGTGNTSVLGLGNVAFSINDHGQVTGVSALAGNTNFRAFRWTKETGMLDLGLLSGDVDSAGLGINEGGEVVGASIGTGGPLVTVRAFLWQNGVMSDLNALVQKDSPLYLLTAFAINDAGVIAGFGVNPSTGDIHAFLATPCGQNRPNTDWCKGDTGAAAAEGGQTTERPKPFLSESARELLQQHLWRR